ncbi:MAG: hypothetical protein SH847_26515 [Roseiflexaceae bacterium]|nr:hypothetical protein [Roseiflexaceae bacterium]
MTAETPSVSNERLLHAFGCSLDDLVANRRGSLTPHQQQIVAQQIAIGSWSSGLAALVILSSAAFFLIGAPFLIKDGPVPPQAVPYLIGTMLGVLGIVSVFIGIGMRRVQVLRQAHISVIEGPIRCTTKQFRHGRWIAYYAWIGHLRFQLTTQKQYKLLEEGNSYRIYYINYPPVQLILSIEELSRDNDGVVVLP